MCCTKRQGKQAASIVFVTAQFQILGKGCFGDAKHFQIGKEPQLPKTMRALLVFSFRNRRREPAQKVFLKMTRKKEPTHVDYDFE
jgi:hypothetical protein